VISGLDAVIYASRAMRSLADAARTTRKPYFRPWGGLARYFVYIGPANLSKREQKDSKKDSKDIETVGTDKRNKSTQLMSQS
jgi:hypothetical protein